MQKVFGSFSKIAIGKKAKLFLYIVVWVIMLKIDNVKCSGPSKSPVTAPSPAHHGSHGIPVAPPPEDVSNYSAPATEGILPHTMLLQLVSQNVLLLIS